MRRCFCVGFIDFMLASKTLMITLVYFPPDDFAKNDKNF